MCEVVNLELAHIALYNPDIVTKLFIGDDVVTVSVHFVKGLDNFDNLNASRNERLLDLMPLKTAKFRSLRLEDLPKRLSRIVIEVLPTVWTYGRFFCFFPFWWSLFR